MSILNLKILTMKMKYREHTVCFPDSMGAHYNGRSLCLREISKSLIIMHTPATWILGPDLFTIEALHLSTQYQVFLCLGQTYASRFKNLGKLGELTSILEKTWVQTSNVFSWKRIRLMQSSSWGCICRCFPTWVFLLSYNLLVVKRMQ